MTKGVTPKSTTHFLRLARFFGRETLGSRRSTQSKLRVSMVELPFAIVPAEVSLVFM